MMRSVFLSSFDAAALEDHGVGRQKREGRRAVLRFQRLLIAMTTEATVAESATPCALAGSVDPGIAHTAANTNT